MKNDMPYMNPETRFGLDAPYFEEMRLELSSEISDVLYRMRERRMNSATITLKISIATEEIMLADANAQMGVRPALEPSINYTLTLTMQDKSDLKGDIGGKGKELVQGRDGRFYLVSREEASGQMSMFNSWDEYHEVMRT